MGIALVVCAIVLLVIAHRDIKKTEQEYRDRINKLGEIDEPRR